MSALAVVALVVGAWLAVFVLVLALCLACARGDRQVFAAVDESGDRGPGVLLFLHGDDLEVDVR